MNCLWCQEEMLHEVGWSNIILPTKPKRICDNCESGFKQLSGKRCKRCSRETKSEICEDCLWWKKQHQGEDVIDFNYSVFGYNTEMQDVIAKWKYRGDYELGYIFEQSFVEHFYRTFHGYKDVIAVPIPLSKERLLERCFNQASMLSSFLPIQTSHVLTRVHGEKQSKKSRKERITSENPFILQNTLNKSVILVDDIYTTGTTLRHAASLLKKTGCPKVYTYTLVRG
jgi:competence protein ComFC